MGNTQRQSVVDTVLVKTRPVTRSSGSAIFTKHDYSRNLLSFFKDQSFEKEYLEFCHGDRFQNVLISVIFVSLLWGVATFNDVLVNVLGTSSYGIGYEGILIFRFIVLSFAVVSMIIGFFNLFIKFKYYYLFNEAVIFILVVAVVIGMSVITRYFAWSNVKNGVFKHDYARYHGLYLVIFFSNMLLKMRIPSFFLSSTVVVITWNVTGVIFREYTGIWEFSIILVILCALCVSFQIGKDLVDRKRFVAQKRVEHTEKKMSTELLRGRLLLQNIIPQVYLDRFVNREFLLDSFSEMLVLEGDIVGFSILAGMVSSRELIHILNHVYSAIDDLCVQYECEKIRTIGDSYVLAKFDVEKSSVTSIVALGVEILSFLRSKKYQRHKKKKNPFSFEDEEEVEEEYGVHRVEDFAVSMRMGIAEGPGRVCCLGATRMSVEIFGDVMAQSINLERSAPVSRIHVNEPIMRKISDTYSFEVYKNEDNVNQNNAGGGKDLNELSYLLVDDEDGVDKDQSVKRVDAEVVFALEKRIVQCFDLNCIIESDSPNNSIKEYVHRSNSGESVSGSKKKTKKNWIWRKCETFWCLLREFMSDLTYTKELHRSSNLNVIAMFALPFNFALIIAFLLFFHGIHYIYNLSFIIWCSIVAALLLLEVVHFFLSMFLKVYAVSYIIQIVESVAILVFYSTSFWAVRDENSSRFAEFVFMTVQQSFLFLNILPYSFVLVLQLSTIVSFFLLQYIYFAAEKITIPINGLVYTVLIVLISFQSHYSNYQYCRNKKNLERRCRNLESELSKNSTIIKSILPDRIYTKLCSKSRVFFASCPFVTVVYLKVKKIASFDIGDLKSVSKLDEIDYLQLLESLHEIFSSFDELLDRYRCTKVKSCWNDYLMFCGTETQGEGVSGKIHDCKSDTLKNAIDMAKQCRQIATDNNGIVQIGITQGNISTGIVGKRKIFYDAFGSPLNLAQRLASFASPNTIQCTARFVDVFFQTANHDAKEKITLRKRGSFEIKGMTDEMTVFLVD